MRVQVFIRTKEKLEPGLRKPSNEEETDSIESSNECNLQIKRITSLIQPDLKTEYKEKKKEEKNISFCTPEEADRIKNAANIWSVPKGVGLSNQLVTWLVNSRK